jgi:ATP-binding cassette subfamily A (ABC1) protein 3
VKEPGCDAQRITDLLKSKLEDVEEEQNIGAELTYTLSDQQSHLFAPVFEELEMNKTELGIGSYGASITTMEEIFMRLVAVGYIFEITVCFTKI